jgi:hypothetical protein
MDRHTSLCAYWCHRRQWGGLLLSGFSLGYALTPPWSIEELNDACFVARDHNGQQLACVYFRERLKEKPAVGRGGGS